MKEKIAKLVAFLLATTCVFSLGAPVFGQGEQGEPAAGSQQVQQRDKEDEKQENDNSEAANAQEQQPAKEDSTSGEEGQPREGQGAFSLGDGTTTYFTKGGYMLRSSGLNSSAAVHWDYANQYFGPIITDGDDNYYFCTEVLKDFPTGQTYTKKVLTDARYIALLYHGYPNNSSDLLSKYPRSKQQALLSVYIAANVLSGGYTESIVRSQGDKYVNTLLDLAQAKDTGAQSLTASKSSLTGTYNESTNRLETEYISYTGTSTSFSVSGLPKNTYLVDENGDKIAGKVKTGQKFKVVSEDLGLNSVKNLAPTDHGLTSTIYYQYDPPTDNLQKVIGGEKKTVPLEVAPFAVKWKQALGKAVIKKTSEDGVIAGLKFEIKGTDGNTKGFTKVVETDKDGGFTVKDLVPGEYTVTELETPQRYVTMPSVVITVKAGQTETVTFNNALKKGRVKIYKTQWEQTGDGVPLEGVQFTVYRYDAKTKKLGDKVATLTTDKKGCAVSGELPYGSYILKETKALAGYEPCDEEWQFAIAKDGEELYYHMQNRKKEEFQQQRYDHVQTGDSGEPLLFWFTGAISAALCLAILKRRIKHNQGQGNT